MALYELELNQWIFASGDTYDCLSEGNLVTIPHTWNTDPATEERNGIGWYEYRLFMKKEWSGKRLFLFFHSVYHDAVIYVNGQEAGRHDNSGYTPFSVEITDYLKTNEENSIIVRADNRFSDQMLPYKRSFDWANDGGIIRPVFLQITGQNRILSAQISASPIITAENERQDEGFAVFSAGIAISCQSEGGNNSVLSWSLCDNASNAIVLSGSAQAAGSKISIPRHLLTGISYWHFDCPRLYSLKLELTDNSGLSDQRTFSVGFRRLLLKGDRMYFNGEPVRLPGMEWMPGSDPDTGMAESKEQLEQMLRRLKEANCVLTRFHWQQDDWVYDWCDRNGLLVQEEIPFWGKEPEHAGKLQWNAASSQLEEMITAHQTHPSIIAWGVGNELDAQDASVIQYIKDAVAFVHRLDPDRLANYVSNTVWQNPAGDGTAIGDLLMINDYIGTWHTGYDPLEAWEETIRTNPGRVLIPAEFGLCEPAFEGGDPCREAIFLSKLNCYRQFPSIGGTIYFCLNDYRTQMGEDGNGRLRRRVHGSADWYGNPKPSYYTVQKEYAPLEVTCLENRIQIFCKDTIPCYTVKGYRIKAGSTILNLPDLKPSQQIIIEIPGLKPGEKAAILRA